MEDKGLKLSAKTILIGFAVSTLLGLTGSPLSAYFKRVKLNEPPPSFTLEDLRGDTWKSADLLAGKVTVVIFWTTWNFRSGDILRDMDALRKELGPEKLQLIAINAEHEHISSSDRMAIEKMLEELGFQSLVLLDEGLVTFNAFGTIAFPSSIVVDENGNVAYTLAGYANTMRSELSDAVRKALGLPTSVELQPPEEYVPKNHALMYYNLARRLVSKGQHEKAEARFLVAVERDPDWKKSHRELGLLYKKTGRFEKALEEFEKVQELDPQDREANYQLAVVRLRSGLFPEAEQLFQGMVDNFPEREEFALGLALAHKYQGHGEEYRKFLDHSATILPAEPLYHYDLGDAAEAQGDLETAAGLYRRALEAAFTADGR